MKQAVDLLLSAERPLIITGTGVWWSQAADKLKEFVELTKVPLSIGRFNSGGYIGLPADHPLYLGLMGGADRADVVMVLGARINWNLSFGHLPTFSEDSKCIQVDIEATEIGHNRSLVSRGSPTPVTAMNLTSCHTNNGL